MNIRAQRKAKVRFRGQQVEVEAFVIGRKGWMAPTYIYLKYQGRWITPLEQRVRDWELPIALSLLFLYAGEPIKNLIYDRNPFLELFPKESDWAGHYVPVPLRIK